MQVRYTKKQRRRLRLVGGLFLLSISSWGLGIERGNAQQLAAAVDQSPSLQTDAAPRKPAKKEGAVTTIAALSSSPSAAPSSTGDAKPTSKPKSRASTRGPYYVDFRARTAASYGHAFVWYGKTSARKVEVAGLHPAGDLLPYMLGHLTWVPAETGASYGDLDVQYLTANYRVYLSEPDAKKIFAYIKELQASSKFWNAETNNCTSFVGKIAAYMGLKTPFHLIFPEQYINDLKEMNGGRQTVQLVSE